MSNLKNVEALIARGDLIAASHLLDARGATQSDNPRELVVASRLWCLRGRFADARELLDRALHADRPVVFEAITDPDVPTLPPHITLEQAKNFTASLLKGDPNEGGIFKQAVKGMVDSILPHKS